MKKTMFGFIADLFVPVPPVVHTDLTGKTVIVIGASAGLGFETAKHLARMNPGKLILGCRNPERGQIAVQRIKRETGCTTAEVWLVDLCVLSSTIAFADRVMRDLDRLDILILNAGILPNPSGEYLTTKDGFEQTLQTNNISQSLIALRALPLMDQTAKTYSTKPRIVVVSSEAHHWGKITDEVLSSYNAIETLGSEEYHRTGNRGSGVPRYCDTKLLNMFFVRGLHNRLKSSAITVSAINPGLCHSEIRRDEEGIQARIMKFQDYLLARQTEEGGRLITWACVGGDESEGVDLRGAYINLNKVEEPCDILLGWEGRMREHKLWNDLVEVLADFDTGLNDVVRNHLNAIKI